LDLQLPSNTVRKQALVVETIQSVVFCCGNFRKRIQSLFHGGGTKAAPWPTMTTRHLWLLSTLPCIWGNETVELIYEWINRNNLKTSREQKAMMVLQVTDSWKKSLEPT